MLLTVFNGSPRGKHSNTAALIGQFLKGFYEDGRNSYQIIYLSPEQVTETQLRFFKDAETVLFAFPLYAASMPAMAKLFIEALQPITGRQGNPRLGYLIHSALPETLHARPLERYLEKLSKRLGCKYMGTMIRGGVESIRGRPERIGRSLRQTFYLLGKHFGATGQLSPELLYHLAQPEKLSPFWLRSFTLLARTGLSNYEWDQQLSANNALEQRFAQPYKRDPGL